MKQPLKHFQLIIEGSIAIAFANYPINDDTFVDDFYWSGTDQKNRYFGHINSRGIIFDQNMDEYSNKFISNALMNTKIKIQFDTYVQKLKDIYFPIAMYSS
ncbi:MAG: hypothetical protein LBS76_03750 [Mycoplasmataceae bacterium]|jgi:hypothetical protein|nr:hypothetical protein [Mycoplasmataceae bacterium]